MAETHPVELNEDGTVSLSVAGKPYMLRRPTFGELRRFREAQFAVEDDAAEDGRHKAKRLEAIRERLAELGTLTYDPETALWSDVPDAKITDDDETEVLDLGNEANKLRRESEFLRADERLALVVDIFNTLTDSTAFTTDAAEAWMSAPGLPGLLVSHGRKIPLALGSS